MSAVHTPAQSCYAEYKNNIVYPFSMSSNSRPQVCGTHALDVQIGNNAVNTFVKADAQFPFVRKDGYIGLAGLLKKLKKVTFDFISMHLKKRINRFCRPFCLYIIFDYFCRSVVIN